MKNRQWLVVSLCWLAAAAMLLAGCGKSKEEKQALAEEARRTAQIQEAQEIARQLKENPPPDPEAVNLEFIKSAANTANLEADFRFMYMGNDPDFFFDGTGGAYADKWANVYYRDFVGEMVKHKVASQGRLPRWNKSLTEARLVFEIYALRKGEWEGDCKGIGIVGINNPEAGVQVVSNKPGFNPYYVNDGTSIVFQYDDKFLMIDDKLEEREISGDDFVRLVRERYTVDCPWEMTGEYRKTPGIWLHSPDGQFHNQIWTVENLEVAKLTPGTCHIYFVSSDSSGLLRMAPAAVRTFILSTGTAGGVELGALYDVFERRLSPISGEAIGINAQRWRGTIRVTAADDKSARAELVTRTFRETIIPGDLFTKYDQTEAIGNVATVEDMLAAGQTEPATPPAAPPEAPPPAPPA